MADDREGEEQPSGPPPPMIPEEDRIYLSSQPNGVCWYDKRIVELLGRSFTDIYHEYVTCWSDASARQRDAMYLYFAILLMSRVDTSYNLRAAYESRIKTRITVTINRVAKKGKRPIWMPTLHFTRLMKRAEDPNWNAKAGKAKANMLKGGKDGKVPSTSTLGQQSAARTFSNLWDGLRGSTWAIVKVQEKQERRMDNAES
ncbi:hypothetical protein OROHE_016459 [Orobanche hederae]